jgi:hypothetical protein
MEFFCPQFVLRVHISLSAKQNKIPNFPRGQITGKESQVADALPELHSKLFAKGVVRHISNFI